MRKAARKAKTGGELCAWEKAQGQGPQGRGQGHSRSNRACVGLECRKEGRAGSCVTREVRSPKESTRGHSREDGPQVTSEGALSCHLER